ncbi:MAG: glycosyltransferase family 2 protein [Thermoproteota archaeon]
MVANPTYSICITCRNEINTICASLDSILEQIDERFEVVVVDSQSTDGTLSVLQEYAKLGKIKLIVKKCTRGKGRRIAFENSSGEYIISGLDMDDIIAPKLNQFIDFYHGKCEGMLLLATSNSLERGSQNVIIAPRSLILQIGDWRNLKYSEDWDVWSRAAKIGRYRFTAFNLIKRHGIHLEREEPLKKLRLRMAQYTDRYRLGRRIWSKEERINVVQRLIQLAARFAALFMESYKDDFNARFEPYDMSYYVPPSNATCFR